MAPARSNADRASAAKSAKTPSRSSASSDQNELDALRKENEELRRNSQYRSLFLSRLAHELRTPLTSILGFSEILLSQEKLTDVQRGFCGRIQSSAQQLQANLNQLSDLARLEGAQAKLLPRQILFAEVMREVLPALSRPLEKKRVKVSWTSPDDLPAMHSDPARVRLILYNVLSYAISRSPESATVLVDAAATSESISITVRDSGDPVIDPKRVGILDADDNSNSGELGMSIARLNIQMLGGSVAAKNLADGVAVSVKLPWTVAQSG